MQLSKKTRGIITIVLIALGISLIVNISDILFMIRISAEQSSRLAEMEHVAMDTVTVQGRTYIVPASKYQRVRRDTVGSNGKGLTGSLPATPPISDTVFTVSPTANDSIAGVDTSRHTNAIIAQDQRPSKGAGYGQPHGYYRRPTAIAFAVAQTAHYQALQLLYYFALGFILIAISSYQSKRKSAWGFPIRLGICLFVTVVAFFLAPNVASNGEMIPTMKFPGREMYDTTLLLKCSLVFLVAALYGKIYELITQRQNIILENEKLKSENLQATYSTLINQMNPHFFFNSLNSLSMLVRESHNKQALTYIDRLSDTFRYILQNGATGMITLEEELKFTEAYKYLLEVRYEGKLFVNFSADEKYMHWMLPSFTLQPLLENAVKHNTITKAEPLHVEIATDGDNNIRISNSFNPKMDEGEGTGIGLSNLSERYRLLTGKDITVIHTEAEFTVILPLTAPAE